MDVIYWISLIGTIIGSGIGAGFIPNARKLLNR